MQLIEKKSGSFDTTKFEDHYGTALHNAGRLGKFGARTGSDVIAAGVTEGELVARVLRQFPHLTMAELSMALQVATTAAERQATRRPAGAHPRCPRREIRR